jgi:hypothetical protein
MFWLVVGLGLGYVMGMNRKISDLPTDLEKCNMERSKHEEDIAYYKKLTKTLVEENKELRIKNASKS